MVNFASLIDLWRAAHIFTLRAACGRDVTEPANIYPHLSDADFMCKIRPIWMRIRTCRVIKITSYYGYCNST